MIAELTNYLICPQSDSELKLVPLEIMGDEINTGLLFTESKEFFYPIINGIPRMLPDSLNYFGKEIKTYYSQLSNSLISRIEEYQKKEISKNNFNHIHSSFTFEWGKVNNSDFAWGRDINTRFSEFINRLDISERVLNGSKILDVGCGHGEIELGLLDREIEIFALDLSFSLDDLKERLKKFNPNPKAKVHLIQANVFNIPLRKIFNLVFCDGVLHHTPNTYIAFKSIVSKLCVNGKCFIMVYSSDHKNLIEKIVITLNSIARKITIRLPHKFLYLIYMSLAPLHWIYVNIYNKLSKSIRYTPRSIRETRLSLFDGFSPKFDWHHTTKEVFNWYNELSFRDVKKTFFNHTGIGIVGTLENKHNIL